MFYVLSCFKVTAKSTCDLFPYCVCMYRYPLNLFYINHSFYLRLDYLPQFTVKIKVQLLQKLPTDYKNKIYICD